MNNEEDPAQLKDFASGMSSIAVGIKAPPELEILAKQ